MKNYVLRFNKFIHFRYQFEIFFPFGLRCSWEPSQKGLFEDPLHIQYKTVRDSSQVKRNGKNLSSVSFKSAFNFLCEPSQKGCFLLAPHEHQAYVFPFSISIRYGSKAAGFPTALLPWINSTYQKNYKFKIYGYSTYVWS